MQTLSSIRLQPMINIKNLGTDLWCPTLNFGRKKSGRFRFPIIFKNYAKAEKLYWELDQLKGQTLEKVKAQSERLYNKYKKFHYKK